MDIITVSPQVVVAGVSKKDPDKNFTDLPSMWMGRATANDISRLLMKFPVSLIPANAMIIEAILSINVQYVSSYFNTPSDFNSYALTQDWSASSVTWNNQPAFDVAVHGESTRVSVAGRYAFDITTLVREWYAGNLPNYGFVLKNDELQNGTSKNVVTVYNKTTSPNVQISYILNPQIPSGGFIEVIEDVNTNGSYNFTSAQDTSLVKMLTYFIKNMGQYPITAKVQIGPFFLDLADDNQIDVIQPNEVKALIPYFFAKYTRLGVKNIANNQTVPVRVWYQAQI